ncbi:MAG: HD domain-containing protein [Alphaproteobacteria bacterium]|nr:HD domain-containing protein [Alphaproteobacteria bacterium]
MEKLEKDAQIKEYFDFYQKKVLPYVKKYATQPLKGYHGLEDHTDAVVFRAIDYALELGKNPIPVIFAAACHDMARINDNEDPGHAERALPLAQKVMNRFPKRLTDTEKETVLTAIRMHTTGSQASDYICACLWDADRTRLAWERGYHEKYFNTEYAKKIASGDAKTYITRQNKILGRINKDQESNQTISLQKNKKELMKLYNRLKDYFKQ